MFEFQIGDMVRFWKRDTLIGIVVDIIADPIINHNYGPYTPTKHRYIVEWIDGTKGNGYIGYAPEHIFKVEQSGL
jgi:hypothetical protein